MKTKKELKDELEDIFFDALTDKSNPPYYTDKVDPENDGRWQWKVYELCADELIKRGYGDVSEYKAEIERLRQEVRDTNKMARNTIEQYKNNYDNAFERLKAQEREIERLKAEFKQLQTNAEILARGVRDLNHENYELTEKIKQAQIDVLNKVKDIVFDYLGVKNIKEAEALSLLDSTLTYDVVTCGIDELIEEVENDK